jgi:hypothetical protein
MQGNAIKSRDAVARVAVITLLATTLAARAVSATTFMSVEPIPGGDVVGEDTLAVIESAGYANLELNGFPRRSGLPGESGRSFFAVIG